MATFRKLNRLEPTAWLLLSVLLLVMKPIGAAVIVVDETCTLVDAVVAANKDTPVGGCITGQGADSIVLTGDVLLTEAYNGAYGLPSVTSEIALEGNDFTVERDQAAPDFNLFHVLSSGTLTLTNVTAQYGYSGLFNYGTVTLLNSTLTKNLIAVYQPWPSNGDLILQDSSVTDNGTGIFSDYNALVRLYDSVVTGNGGGVYASLTMVNSTISGNSGTGVSGGFSFSSYILNSTISGNGGDGLATDLTHTTLVNTTISGNAGHGIRNFGTYDLDLINTTISGNNIGIYGDFGGTATNTIIANSTVTNCTGEPVTDFGGNFDDDGTCGAGFSTITYLDPLLAYNGGPTLTHALQAGSSAIDATGDCGLATDQRGFLREDGACDSGSYEFGARGRVFELSVVSGICPGAMTIAAADAPPSTGVELFQGPTEGESSVPSGACTGTPLGLSNPDSLALFTTDETGDGSVLLNFDAADCGQLLQGVEQSFCGTSNLTEIESCYTLSLGHTGSGLDPMALPASSPDCEPGDYQPGEVVMLRAAPDPDWEVSSWSGTDDDGSASEMNTVTMPPNEHAVAVNYGQSCSTLTLSHSGAGVDPVAVPLADGTTWDKRTVAASFDAAHSVFAGDVNGDGRMDILGAAFLADDITWWENVLGDGTVWSEHAVEGSFFDVTSVFAADVDGDADLDVLGTSDLLDDITWWENTLGDGTDWVEHTVDGSFFTAQSVYAADVDDDGDMDVAGAAFDADQIAWWENTLGDGTSWTKHTVGQNFDGAFWVHLADVDGDADLDALGAAFLGDAITWWENVLGDGTVWSAHPVDGSFLEAVSVYAADVDGDSDLDVLGTGKLASSVTWWENTAGDGTAWVEHVVDANFDGRSVQAVDVDGDGDEDVLAAAFTDDDVTWWENTLGDGTNWVEHVVDGDFDGARSVYAADVNGDGNLDVLGAGEQADDITWWENVYPGTCPQGQFRFQDRLSLTATPDPGWEISGWTGTDDDASTETTNTAVMPEADHSISVHYVESAPAGFSLSVTGTCPGEVTINVTTPSPDQEVQLFAGTDEGTSYVPWGPCGGTELDLAFGRQWRSVTTDENGEASLTRAVFSAWCDRYLQALDRSCSTSNVTQFP